MDALGRKGRAMSDRRITAALADSAAVAATAPPEHPSQPWHWAVHTESLDLYADPTAPLSREETLLSCGSAVHRAKVSLAADGVAVRVDLLPDADPQHIARLTPTGPIAVTEQAAEMLA